VINLRGKDHKDWYKNEVKTVNKMKVKYYILPLSPHKLPPPDKMRRLVKILQQAPRPVLIHCKAGADRTGLASAVALILFENASLKRAEKQYSLFYLVTSPDSVGKLVFPYYRAWLKDKGLQHTRKNFLLWVQQLHSWGVPKDSIEK